MCICSSSCEGVGAVHVHIFSDVFFVALEFVVGCNKHSGSETWVLSLLVHRKETRLILLASMIRAVNASLFFVSIGLINMLTFSTFTLTTGQPVTPSAAFSFLSLLTTLRITAFNFFIQGVLGMQELKVAFSRIRV